MLDHGNPYPRYVPPVLGSKEAAVDAQGTAVIPAGTRAIFDMAFQGNPRLTRVVLPDSLRQVNTYAFCHTSFCAPVYNRSETILYHYPGQTPYTFFAVPQSVKRLAHGAFLACAALEDVYLARGLEVIEREVFVHTAIRSITIPASVQMVEGFAFRECRDLEQVYLMCPAQVVDPRAFYRCPNVELRHHGWQVTHPRLRP